MKGFADELSANERPVDEQDLLILILGSLGPSFNPCVCSLNRGDVNLEHANSELLSYENLLSQQDKAEESQVYQANYSNVGRDVNPKTFLVVEVEIILVLEDDVAEMVAKVEGIVIFNVIFVPTLDMWFLLATLS